MLGALVRLLLYRFLGARIMLALAVFGWLRRVLGGRRDAGGSRSRVSRSQMSRSQVSGSRVSRSGSDYQPSQGESQIVQREPR
jgi:hypothetical protein